MHREVELYEHYPCSLLLMELQLLMLQLIFATILKSHVIINVRLFVTFMTEENQQQVEQPEEDSYEAIRKRLISGAKELQEHASVEMAVGSQLDKSNEQIRKYNEMIKENNDKINRLDKRYNKEDEKAHQELPGEGAQPDAPSYDEEKAEIEALQERLRELYKEKAELMRK